jgi:hypothetical protein
MDRNCTCVFHNSDWPCPIGEEIFLGGEDPLRRMDWVVVYGWLEHCAPLYSNAAPRSMLPRNKATQEDVCSGNGLAAMPKQTRRRFAPTDLPIIT